MCRRIDHPKSPDMNVIENVWAKVKRKVQYTVPSNRRNMQFDLKFFVAPNRFYG